MIKGVAMGAYTVKNHVLHLDGKPVAQRPTPNKGGPLKAEYLVMHYTAAISAAGAISWLTNPTAKASAHLVIAQDGTVTQLAPLNVVCWHAGKSTWAKRSGCNGFTIGVELANPGPLNTTGAGYATAMEHKPVAAKDVVLAAHKSGGPVLPWAAYPAAQIEAAIGVAQAIVSTYGLRGIVGHEDIAPGRKTDPGPAFPMASFRARVMGRADVAKAPAKKVG